MEPITQYKHYVEIADVDASLHLRLPDLLNYMLHASAQGEDELGTGVEFMRKAYGAGWVLERFAVQIDRLPLYHDTLVIQTWPTTVAHNMVFRAYELSIEHAGGLQPIGQATGIWTIIDLQTRGIAALPFTDSYLWMNHTSDRTVSLARLRHPTAIERVTHCLTHKIHYTDLDLNNHCNSAKYLQFMLNACDVLTGVAPIQIDLRYAHELGPEDTITVEAEATDRQVCYILKTADGQLSCTAVMKA